MVALGEEIDLLGLKNFTVRVETEPPPLLDVTQLDDVALDQVIDNLQALLAVGDQGEASRGG